jgi:hypothetical protein
MKICSKCKEEKEITEFYFKKARNHYESACKKCRTEQVNNYLKNNENLKKIFYSRVQNIKKREIDVMEGLRDYLIKLWIEQDKKCYYSGVEMQLKGYADNINNVATVDRIDSSKGYIEGNIVLCCSIINKMKQNLSIEELIYWCDLIKNKK